MSSSPSERTGSAFSNRCKVPGAATDANTSAMNVTANVNSGPSRSLVKRMRQRPRCMRRAAVELRSKIQPGGRMNRPAIFVGLICIVVAGLPAAVEAGLNVPKANCGPNDRKETGLQGQTTVAERANGAAEKGFNCNLELVSQFQGEGASYGFAWSDQCAYYGTDNNPKQAHPGVVVVDATNRSSLQATAYLNSRAMLEPWESLKVNTARHLLGATKGLGRS